MDPWAYFEQDEKHSRLKPDSERALTCNQKSIRAISTARGRKEESREIKDQTAWRWVGGAGNREAAGRGGIAINLSCSHTLSVFLPTVFTQQIIGEV